MTTKNQPTTKTNCCATCQCVACTCPKDGCSCQTAKSACDCAGNGSK